MNEQMDGWSSMRALSEAFAAELPPKLKLLLIAIAELGTLSLPKLSAFTGMSQQKCDRLVSRLADDGWLETIGILDRR